MGQPKEDNTVEQAMEQGEEVGMTLNTSSTTTPKKKGSVMYYAVMIGLVVIAALAIGLGAGLPQRKSNNDNTMEAPSTEDKKEDDGSAIEKVRISDSTTRSLALMNGETLQNTYLDCDDATVDVRKALLAMANQTIQGYVDSYFNGDGPIFIGPPIMFSPTVDFADGMAESAPADQGTTSGRGQGPAVETTEDSYGTNNQVEGVEEPDVVQSNGEDIFVAYGTEIVKLNVNDQSITQRRKLPEDDCNAQYVRNMLLLDDGDRLVVFSGGYCVEDAGDAPGPEIAFSRIIGPPIYGTEITKVIIYDTSDLSVVGDPEVLQGSYINARAIGDEVYIVTSRSLNIYPFLSRFDPWVITEGSKEINATEYEAMAWEIAESTVDEYVEQLLSDLDCETLQQITLFQNTDDILPYGHVMESVAIVHGFSISDPTDISTSSRVMPTSFWQIYASESTLVLCAEGYWMGDDVQTETYVLAYGLDNGQVAPLGLGTIPGYVLNQFSIDEHNGYLRFASSIRQRWRWFEDDGLWQSQPVGDVDNIITVLQVPGGGNAEMEKVGELKGLGKPGERIYSVRFIEDRSFVVTFNETDPFYTIDMSDPTDPQQIGELEIPGYSNYLHPMGDNHIIGVGQHVEDNRNAGLQISLFDVSDFSNPLRVANLIESGGDGSSSEAQYNHQAFRLLQNGLLILPVQVNDWSRPWVVDEEESSEGEVDETFDGFKIYFVDNEKNEVTLYHEVSHGSNFYNGCWSYSAYLSPRSLVFGGNLWTLKSHTALVHDLTNRVQVGDSAINFDENIPEEECYPFYFRGGPEPIMVVD